MSKGNVAFFAGLVISFLVLYVAGEVLVTAGMEKIRAEEIQNAPSQSEYKVMLRRQAEPVILFIAVIGGFAAGAVCRLYAAKAPVQKVAHGTVIDWLADRARAKGDEPLTKQEFERVRQSCLFVNPQERSAAYLQGIIVGRLAETAPDLAAKVDRFSEAHMEVIRQEILQTSVMT